MISTKRVINLARKWQKMAAMKCRRITFASKDGFLYSSVASKGHFVVYTIDKKRFEVPLRCLSSNVIGELLRKSEAEFGLLTGQITLPCDSAFLDYAISIVQGSVPKEVEKAYMLTSSMATCHHSASSSLGLGQSCHQQTLIYGF